MKDEITYDDFAKLDLRVGTILDVDDIEGADKLFKLTIDVGEDIGERTVCAGIKEYFPAKEDLVGKQCVLLVNLAPRTLRGVDSQGMILAAGDKEDGFVLLKPSEELEPGTSVS